MSVQGGAKHWLLFDGACGFCGRVAGWVAQRDGGRRLQVVAYQEAPSPPMTPDLYVACGEAMQVVTRRGRVLAGGDAVIFTLGAIGARPLARLLWQWPLRSLVNRIYPVVAGMRECAGGQCETPPAGGTA